MQNVYRSARAFFLAAIAPVFPLCKERIVYAYKIQDIDMHRRSNAHCRGRGRERELLVYDEIFAQRDNEKDTKEGSTDDDCNQLPDILLRNVRKQV
jgi:hypothetical protein